MPEHPWSHLQHVVDALTAADNAVEPPGFHPTQGGWACQMTGPLDDATAAACVRADSRLTYRDDELSCQHCWTMIAGSNARARHQHAHRAARDEGRAGADTDTPPGPAPRPPWFRPGAQHSSRLTREANAEIGSGHDLSGLQLIAVAACEGCDRVIFRVNDDTFAIVHLTWASRSETPPWPATQRLASFLALESVADNHQH